jgi:hypothetical protein
LLSLGLQILPVEYGGAAELVPVEAAVAARQQQQTASTAEPSPAAQGRSPTSSDGNNGSKLALARRASSAALGAARRLAHQGVNHLGGAAAGAAAGAQRAARALHHGQQQLRRRGGHSEAGGDGKAGEQPRLQRALSMGPAQAYQALVVLQQVLLVGLLLRVLRTVLQRRRGGAVEPAAESGDASQQPSVSQAAPQAVEGDIGGGAVEGQCMRAADVTLAGAGTLTPLHANA